MMKFQQDGRRTRRARGAFAALLAASVVLDSVPAAAQRRRGEPEANPEFQNQLQAPGAGGGPLAEAESGPLGADEALPQRQVQGVQIGAAAPARSAAERSVAPLDTRVTVRVKGAPLATFLDTISAQAKVNFIITEGLESKRVTAFLQNVTVREALQVLLEIKGLTYQQIGKSNTYVVTPRSKQVENLITRIYTLNYIPLIALGPDSAGPRLLTLGGGSGGSSGSSSAGSAGTGSSSGMDPSQGGTPGGAGGSGGKEGSSGIAIVRVLRSVLSKSGHVELEPRTNAIVVTDIPEVFPQVEQIIGELDKKAPQVMIEAQIVEIDSNRSRELGFEWGGVNGELGSFKGGARDTTFPLNLPRNLSTAKFFDPLNPTSGIKSALGSGGESGGNNEEGSEQLFRDKGILLTSVLDLTALQITLRALVSRSEARFLGKPKILTLNNKSAIIQIGSNEAVALQNTQASAGGGGTSTQIQSAERMPTGLVLSVTPQINREGYITMLVQPSFTDVQEAAISVASARVFNPVQRAASTLVRVKNGQTLVMGGLLRSTETKVVRKVPFFGYIPIVGWLFTSTSNRRVNSDLVIFLTPTIVSD